jgi:hypothetical protein
MDLSRDRLILELDRPQSRSGLSVEKRKKSCLAGNRTPAVQPVAIPTELSRLLCFHIAAESPNKVPMTCTIRGTTAIILPLTRRAWLQHNLHVNHKPALTSYFTAWISVTQHGRDACSSYTPRELTNYLARWLFSRRLWLRILNSRWLSSASTIFHTRFQDRETRFCQGVSQTDFPN